MTGRSELWGAVKCRGTKASVLVEAERAGRVLRKHSLSGCPRRPELSASFFAACACQRWVERYVLEIVFSVLSVIQRGVQDVEKQLGLQTGKGQSCKSGGPRLCREKRGGDETLGWGGSLSLLIR